MPTLVVTFIQVICQSNQISVSEFQLGQILWFRDKERHADE